MARFCGTIKLLVVDNIMESLRNLTFRKVLYENTIHRELFESILGWKFAG